MATAGGSRLASGMRYDRQSTTYRARLPPYSAADFSSILMSMRLHTFNHARPDLAPYEFTCERWKAALMLRPARHNEIEQGAMPSSYCLERRMPRSARSPGGTTPIQWRAMAAGTRKDNGYISVPAAGSGLPALHPDARVHGIRGARRAAHPPRPNRLTPPPRFSRVGALDPAASASDSGDPSTSLGRGWDSREGQPLPRSTSRRSTKNIARRTQAGTPSTQHFFPARFHLPDVRAVFSSALASS